MTRQPGPQGPEADPLEPHAPETEQPEEQPPSSGPPRARGTIDPNAKWALAVAGLGMPLSFLMALDLLLYGVQYSLCTPDYTCGGLPSHDVYTGWFIGAVGFAGPMSLVVAFSGRGQRLLRWVCACAAVACPVVVMLVAARLSQPPPP